MFAAHMTVRHALQELIHERMKKLYFCAPTLDLPSTWEVIKKHYLFDHFSEEELHEVMESGDIVLYNPNDALFVAGAPAMRVFFILRGSATRRVRNPMPTNPFPCPRTPARGCQPWGAACLRVLPSANSAAQPLLGAASHRALRGNVRGSVRGHALTPATRR
jgi:hypothetical protein